MGINHGVTPPPEFVLGGTAMMLVLPEFSTYNVLNNNNAVCCLLWSTYVLEQTIHYIFAL